MNRPNWKEYFKEIVQVTAKRSSCNRLNVGCVLVKENSKRFRLTSFQDSRFPSLSVLFWVSVSQLFWRAPQLSSFSAPQWVPYLLASGTINIYNLLKHVSIIIIAVVHIINACNWNYCGQITREHSLSCTEGDHGLIISWSRLLSTFCFAAYFAGSSNSQAE